MTSAPGRFERVAHRGSPSQRRENTLSGFLLALEHGADAIELDVHRTVDGVVIVHHDPRVQGRLIEESTWEALAGTDLGSGARIPTLAETLASIGERAVVYVELKGRAIEQAVIDVLRAHGRRFAVHSFDHAAVERAALLAPDIPRGVLLDENVLDAARAMRTAVALTLARDVWPHWTLVDEVLMDVARELGLRVIPWTVNSPAAARRLLALGVHGVCTDDVRMLANL